MRSVVLLFVAAFLSAEAPPPDFQPYEQALAGSHFAEAAAFTDKLLAARTPADGKPRPDPLLNALIGRLYLVAHNVEAASIYLDHAPIADLPPALRGPTALDHGRALEFRGERDGALKAYREAAAASSTPSERRRASLGIARQLLVANPSAAAATVVDVANGPPTAERWEANYLLSLSYSLLGNAESASKFADTAWADAADAPVPALAPLHVAALRAGLAAARHDAAAERSMLTATNGLALSASPELSTQLPVCGDRGLRPSDYVIFSFVAGPYVTHRLIPVAASRIEAIVPFADALAGITPVTQGTGRTPVGTVFTVSCRSVVAGGFVAENVHDPLIAWFVEHGIYAASASFDDADEHLNAIAARIDSLAARYGKDSPLLIGPRWQFGLMLEKRARNGDPVSPGQVGDLDKQAAAGMRAAGAPEYLARALDVHVGLEQAAAAAATDPSQASAFVAAQREQFLQMPFPIARTIFNGMVRNIKDEWPPEASKLLIDLNGRAPPSMAGRERQAWLRRLADAQRSLGKNGDASRTLASAGFERDLCVMGDSQPKLLEQHFSYSDYPPGLVAGEQEGSVLFDFNLSPSGDIAGERIVYSLPAGIFDAPSAKGLGTVRYAAPSRSGKPSSCRGVFQPIVWRLEEDEDFTLPVFSRGLTGPTT